jgi:sialic acid synthase SpsE
MESGSRRFPSEIRIGDRIVGDGHPCFVIAEIGANHNRDFDMARRLIDMATDAGADCVKFQTFLADKHFSVHTPPISGFDKHIHTVIRETELDRDWLEPLKRHVEARGAVFMSSLGDVVALDLLEKIGTVAYKNTSFELTDVELIGCMATTGKPVILSTGLAYRDDIRRGLDSCVAAGNDQVILLQCASLYPAPPALANLRAIDTMRRMFGTLVGYSDHTLDDHVALAAVARGACVVEKHVTLDRSLPGPDHGFAMEPAPFAAMLSRLRDIEAALGDGVKDGPREAEMENFRMGRRSLHAAVEIPAGTRISDEMLCVKRPGMGIEPYRRREIVGRTAKATIRMDHWITEDMLR